MEFFVDRATFFAFNGNSVSGVEMHLDVGGFIEAEEICTDVIFCHGFGVCFHEFFEGVRWGDFVRKA